MPIGYHPRLQTTRVRIDCGKSDAGKNKKNDGPAKIGQIGPPFAAQAFLDSADVSNKIVDSRPLAVIFAQGDPCDSVMYIQGGRCQTLRTVALR